MYTYVTAFTQQKQCLFIFIFDSRVHAAFEEQKEKLHKLRKNMYLMSF